MVRLNDRNAVPKAAPATQETDKVAAEPTPRATPHAKVIGRDCDDGEEKMSLKIS